MGTRRSCHQQYIVFETRHHQSTSKKLSLQSTMRKKYGRRHLPSIIIGPLRLHEGKRLIVINFLCSIPIIRDYTERHTSEKERKALMMNGFLVTLLTLSKEHVCKTSKQFTTSVGDDDEIRAEDDNLIGLFVSQLTRPPPTTNIT